MSDCSFCHYGHIEVPVHDDRYGNLEAGDVVRIACPACTPRQLRDALEEMRRLEDGSAQDKAYIRRLETQLQIAQTEHIAFRDAVAAIVAKSDAIVYSHLRQEARDIVNSLKKLLHLPYPGPDI